MHSRARRCRRSSSTSASSLRKTDVEQMEKIVALITCEIALCQLMCELVFRVTIFDLDFWVQVDSVLDDHLDHSFIMVKNVEHRTRLTRFHVSRNIIEVAKFKIVVLSWSLNLVLG